MQTPEEDPLWDGDLEGSDENQLPANTSRPHDGGDGPKRFQLELIRKAWKPEPIEKPTIDPELPKMHWPERCAEAIRYAFLTAEHWISRHGVLREWLRLNLWVGVALLAAALLVVPPVTMLLEGVAEWASLIESTTSNVVATVMGLPPIVIAISSVLILIKVLSLRWQRRKRRRGYQDQNDPYN
ncbi:MAG: hypothetical protein ACI8XO_000281 [Verrucomicrobiales bacterium]|jgi:hypothetical protein